MASDLVLKERLHDVVLKVRHDGFTWRMPAHSLLLANKSRVFQEMVEEREDTPAHITLVGVRPETALAMLSYIYSGEMPADPTADLLIASRRYDLTDLHRHLEGRLLTDLGVEGACSLLEELQGRQPVEPECAARTACRALILRHALAVFGSDLVLRLSKATLCRLLESDCLNVPDEAYVFWGVWRWGRAQSSKHDRSLRDEDVQAYIDELMVLIRTCSLKCREGIPAVAAARFDKCKGRRTLYAPPADALEQCASLRPTPSFEGTVPVKSAQDGTLCVQMSVEKDAMLVGLSLEICNADSTESFVRVIRESDGAELRRTRVCWCERKTGEDESRLEAEVTLQQPLFLTPGNLYSVKLTGDFGDICWGPLRKTRARAGNTHLNFHGEGVAAVRNLYLVPDMTVTWGPRGPSV